MPHPDQSPVPSREIEFERVHLRDAHNWSMATVIWTVFASGIAIAAGVAAGSLLLVSFGAIGTLDAVGSVVLVVHFRHALRHEAISLRHERIALATIAAGMAFVALTTAIASGHRLVGHTGADSSPVGVSIAACSVLALAVLAGGKRRVGGRVASRALIADSHVSTVGALLALFTVAGTTATSTLSWWWLDPSASLCVAMVAIAVAAGHARAASAG